VDWVLTTGFGRRVLEATAAIPFGRVSTYREIAAVAGSPNGSRAAGNALGANPIPIVVPCHRVLRTGGGLGGYTGGIERKARLLQIEGVFGVPD
jgi:methylated-DNA-[protein]-cysteine S-methyltransferase